MKSSAVTAAAASTRFVALLLLLLTVSATANANANEDELFRGRALRTGDRIKSVVSTMNDGTKAAGDDLHGIGRDLAPEERTLAPQLRTSNTNSRIVGGVVSKKGHFPYFVNLNGGCGGALISPSVVLTAAHCGPKAWNTRIYVGAYDRGQATSGAEERKCKAVMQHPSYNGGTLNWDFTLCLLNEEVKIDETEYELVVNANNGFPTTQDPDLIVMGTGTLSSGGSISPVLRNVTVPYITNQQCKNSGYKANEIFDSMLCAGYQDGGKDACQGDSGGPIVKRQYSKTKKRFIDTYVGVVSWGYGCAAKNYPGVYARVSKAHQWIKNVVCDEWNQNDAKFCPQKEPTLAPTMAPCDGAWFKFAMKTDDYGDLDNNSWTLKEQNKNAVISSGSLSQKNEERTWPSQCLKKGKCYTITITDGWGDGICCEYGDGYYKGWLDNVEMDKVNGGTFNNRETVDFCIPDGAPLVSSPTKAPITPTKAPITPTKAPTPPPTKVPTSAPTEAPIQASCVDEVIKIKNMADGCNSWLLKQKKNRKKKCNKKRINDTKIANASSNEGTPIYDICRKTCGEYGVGVCKNMKIYGKMTQKKQKRKKKNQQ